MIPLLSALLVLVAVSIGVSGLGGTRDGASQAGPPAVNVAEPATHHTTTTTGQTAATTETSTAPTTRTEARASTSTTVPLVRAYPVPSSIASDCSRPVDLELLAFFATVPDDSTIAFPSGKCYGQDGELTVNDRKGLVFDGNGSTFQALTQNNGSRSNWKFNGGSRITLRDAILRGFHPSGGTHTSAYVPSLEAQHGVGVGSVQGALIEDVQIFDVYGDFIAAQWDWRFVGRVREAHPVRDLVIRRVRAERNGRQGLFVGHAERVTLESSYLGDISKNAVDLEPDVIEHVAREVRIVGNTFGDTRFSLLSAVSGSGGRVGAITFSRNRMEAPGYTCQPAVTIKGSPGSHKAGIIIEDNVLHQTGPAYWRSAFDLSHARDATIRRNSVTLDGSGGCRDQLPGVWLLDSHNVAVTKNAFSGSEVAVVGDSASTGVTEADNTS